MTVPSVAEPRSGPSGRAKTGLSRASASSEESRRGPSSTDTTVSRPLASRIVTGASSASNRPRVDRRDRLLVALQRERVLVGAATRRRGSRRARRGCPCGSPRTRTTARRGPSSRPACRRPGGSRSGRSGRRNGARFMLSIPPATATSASPARISAAASMIALSPEPQTRLIVVALVVSGSPAGEGRLAGRRLADAGLEDLAHQDLVDRRALGQAGSLHGGPDGDAAELGGGHAAQRAAELADRGALGADDVDVAVRAGWESRAWLESTPGRRRRPWPESGVSAGRCRSRGPSSGRGGRPRRARRASAGGAKRSSPRPAWSTRITPEADIEADEVGQLERSHRMVQAAPRAGVDVLGRAEPLLEGAHRLGQERHQDPVDDEAGPVGRHDHHPRLGPVTLAAVRLQLAPPGRGSRPRSRPRSPELRISSTRRITGTGLKKCIPTNRGRRIRGHGRGQVGDRDRARVRREDRPGLGETVDLSPERPLDVDVLEHGLDHEVGARRRRPAGRSA